MHHQTQQNNKMIMAVRFAFCLKYAKHCGVGTDTVGPLGNLKGQHTECRTPRR